MKKWMWLEEYRNCSCTFTAFFKKELIGYCPKHGTDRKYAMKLPYNGVQAMGYVKG